VEKHLLLDISDEAYIALAKGGVVASGRHFVAVPLAHVAMRSQVTPVVVSEMARFAASVRTAAWALDEVRGVVWMRIIACMS
jgi:hypothetical protein